MNLMLAFSIFALGFEAGGGVTWEQPFGKDIEDFSGTLSWCAEAGIRDILPGIGFDLGMRRFGVEREIEVDSVAHLMRWEGYFYDGSAVFESWPYLKGPLGVRFRAGGFYSPWRMLDNGQVVVIPSTDTLSDTLYMEEKDFGVLLGGSLMFRPLPFLILDLGINHRQIFSLDASKYGDEDEDERFMEAYLGARFRFR